MKYQFDKRIIDAAIARVTACPQTTPATTALRTAMLKNIELRAFTDDQHVKANVEDLERQCGMEPAGWEP